MTDQKQVTPSPREDDEQPTQTFATNPQQTQSNDDVPPTSSYWQTKQQTAWQSSTTALPFMQSKSNTPPAYIPPEESTAYVEYSSARTKSTHKPLYILVLAVIMALMLATTIGVIWGSSVARSEQDTNATSSDVNDSTMNQRQSEKETEQDPVLESITASYIGSMDAGTNVDIDSFSVTGTFDDGSEQHIDGCTVTNPGALVGEQATTFTIDCEGLTTGVEVTGVTPVPVEYESALTQANQYSDLMHMSKQGIYDQLVSEYGGQFTPEAAQWAIDHMHADWKANALQTAKDYQELLAMSPAAIYDQLTSEYGEQFTPEEAQYAIDHLND